MDEDVDRAASSSSADEERDQDREMTPVPRGQKRGRDEPMSIYGDDAEEGEESQMRRPARKRHDTRRKAVAIDPRCEGRKVGDEWTTGKVRFKVGDDGVRLRLATVRETRVKYEMVSSSGTFITRCSF
jgi:hypothetical protein